MSKDEPQRMIEYSFWLTFDYTRQKQGSAPKSTKGEPDTTRNQRAVRCVARLPESLFMTPSVSMVMDVPHSDTPDVLANVKAAGEAFKQTLGFDVDMRISKPEFEE